MPFLGESTGDESKMGPGPLCVQCCAYAYTCVYMCVALCACVYLDLFMGVYRGVKGGPFPCHPSPHSPTKHERLHLLLPVSSLSALVLLTPVFLMVFNLLSKN